MRLDGDACMKSKLGRLIFGKFTHRMQCHPELEEVLVHCIGYWIGSNVLAGSRTDNAVGLYDHGQGGLCLTVE